MNDLPIFTSRHRPIATTLINHLLQRARALGVRIIHHFERSAYARDGFDSTAYHAEPRGGELWLTQPNALQRYY